MKNTDCLQAANTPFIKDLECLIVHLVVDLHHISRTSIYWWSAGPSAAGWPLKRGHQRLWSLAAPKWGMSLRDWWRWDTHHLEVIGINSRKNQTLTHGMCLASLLSKLRRTRHRLSLWDVTQPVKYQSRRRMFALTVTLTLVSQILHWDI